MHKGTLHRLATLVLAMLATTGLAAADEVPSELVGFWKICYAPGLDGVYEPSEGYLALMPDGTYFEVRDDCCDTGPAIGAVRRYEAHGDTVVLHRRRNDGTPYTHEMTYRPAAEVVLFDDLDGEPRELPVLSHGDRLHYGYARVYP